MKALILAAGRGSRLGDAAGGAPKPLVDIHGTTPLRSNLAWLAKLPLESIWINVHADADRIRGHAGNAVDSIPLQYSYEPELLGTAGAWKKLEREWTETSLVIYGDNLMRFDLESLLHVHRAAGTPLTVALFDPATHRNTGIGGGRAVLEAGLITRFEEGGDGDAHQLVNAGAYVIEPTLARELEIGFLDFGHDVLPRLADAGRLGGHVVEADGYCLGVDTPERLAIARQLMQNQEIRA